MQVSIHGDEVPGEKNRVGDDDAARRDLRAQSVSERAEIPRTLKITKPSSSSATSKK